MSVAETKDMAGLGGCSWGSGGGFECQLINEISKVAALEGIKYRRTVTD